MSIMVHEVRSMEASAAAAAASAAVSTLDGAWEASSAISSSLVAAGQKHKLAPLVEVKWRQVSSRSALRQRCCFL